MQPQVFAARDAVLPTRDARDAVLAARDARDAVRATRDAVRGALLMTGRDGCRV